MNSKCRTCLHQDGEMRSLFTKLIIANETVQIADILASFFNYKVEENDGLPQSVCLACTHLLSSVYSFNVVIQNSLIKLYEANIETESCDEHTNVEECEYEEKPNIERLKLKKKESCDEQTNVDCEYEEKPNIERLTLQKKENYNRNRKKKKSAPQEPTVVYCVVCRERFYSMEALAKHCLKQHKPKRKTGRSCDFCNEKFEDLKSLVSHRKYHIYLYVCEICWLGFYLEGDLKRHKCEKPTEKEIIEEDNNMRQCDQCGKSYPVTYIKLHMRIHTSEMFYKCEYCPKKFKVRCSLNSHVLWKHKQSRNHKCDICQASFVTASAKMSHYRKIHLLEKKHACDSCGKRFFSKSELQRHTLTHSGEKNFHCHLCDKSYQTRYGLNVHLKSHSVSVHV